MRTRVESRRTVTSSPALKGGILSLKEDQLIFGIVVGIVVVGIAVGLIV